MPEWVNVPEPSSNKHIFPSHKLKIKMQLWCKEFYLVEKDEKRSHEYIDKVDPTEV